MLIRDPSIFPLQDRFGKSDNPAGQRGNCVQTCLIAVTGIPDVPHFYDTDEAAEDQHVKSQQWLAERGWSKLWIPWEWIESGWVHLPPDALVIVSGKSPRGDWHHVVVGTICGTQWTLVHDPHPSQAGLDGTPNGFYLLTALPTLKDSRCPVASAPS